MKQTENQLKNLVKQAEEASNIKKFQMKLEDMKQLLYF